MRIGVISDTHIPRAADWLPKIVCDDFAKCDLILHAGDLTEKNVLDRLTKIAPVRAVCGNMDEADLKKILPRKDIIEAGKFKIGLTHGFGPPYGLLDRVRQEFGKVDAIVFGHSHSPINEVRDGILFFNPGSPTDKIFSRQNAYGILEIDDAIRGVIIKL